MAKEITLEDLTQSVDNSNKETQENRTIDKQSVVTQPSSFKTARPVSVSELGKNLKSQNKDEDNKNVVKEAPLVADAFSSMDATLREKKRFIEEEMMPVVLENAREMAMEKEIENIGVDAEDIDNNEIFEDNDFDELDDTPNVKYKDEGVYVAPDTININDEDKSNTSKNNKIVEMRKKETNTENTFDDMLKELKLEDDEETFDIEEETTEEMRERFKASLSGIRITRNPIDLSKFQIAKEPISSAAVLSTITNPHKKRCDHPLIHTNRNMTFEECSGPELDALRKTINNSNPINGVIASLRFVYNHVIDANKKTFEAWCKSIRTEDIESLYFGVYKACYGDTNLVARTDGRDDDKKSKSNGCKKSSLIDIPIRNMIKFKDEDAEKLYDDLMNQDSTTHDNKVKSQTMVISDDFVVSYTDPTLYSTFIQYASLKPEITNKYSDYLNTMAYIDGFFRIDYRNNQLIPIAIKEYPNNINKTVMSKLKTYIDILKTLTNDQYNVMVAKLENIVGDTKISYIYPEVPCPECGNTIPEERVDSMLQLLFLRAQWVQVKSL